VNELQPRVDAFVSLRRLHVFAEGARATEIRRHPIAGVREAGLVELEARLVVDAATALALHCSTSTSMVK
jgi:hypothetical protein